MARKLSFIAFAFLCFSLISLVIFEIYAVTQMAFQGNVVLSYKSVKVGDIVQYGEYPQTYVGSSLNSTLISLKNSGSLTATGKTYAAYNFQTLTNFQEYSYNGSKYVYVPAAKFWDGSEEPDSDPNKGKYGDANAKFSTGESAYSQDASVQGKPYFFKVEPISFRVMATNLNNGEFTVQSVKSLGSMAFNRTNGTNTWHNSDMRSYLNGRFLTDSGLNLYAKQTSITNNVTGNYNNGGGTVTSDYIWLASLNDLQAWYSSSLTINSTSTEIRKQLTDFGLATYSRNYTGTNYTYYGLRTAGIAANTVCWVSYHSPAKILTTATSFYVTGSDLGYAPAFIVSLF